MQFLILITLRSTSSNNLNNLHILKNLIKQLTTEPSKNSQLLSVCGFFGILFWVFVSKVYN